MKEEKKETGLFQVFDMERFFDKEIILNTMHRLKKKAKISDKDYITGCGTCSTKMLKYQYVNQTSALLQTAWDRVASELYWHPH